MTFNILAFGDSLTWGVDPGVGRHRFEDRWTSVVERTVADTRIIAEGLPGRTSCFDDHSGTADRNGARALPVLLGSHYPLDLVIIMLGTNDLKSHLCGTADGAAAGVGRLAEITATYPYGYGYPAPKIMIVSPPHLRKPQTGDGILSGERNIAESRRLAELYRIVAERRGCDFLDAASVAFASPLDGVHLDAANSRALGAAVARALVCA